MLKTYNYAFNSYDEDGSVKNELTCIDDVMDEYESIENLQEQCIAFLSQTDYAYLDKYGIVHEIYQEKNQLFCYYFAIEDDDWYEIVGKLGEILADETDEWTSVTNYIFEGIQEMYNLFESIASGKTEAPTI